MFRPFFYDLQLPYLALNIFYFSNHRGVVVFLLLSILIIWQTQLAFLCRILFESVLFSPICSRTSSLVVTSNLSFPFSSSTNISKLSKYFAPIISMSSSLSHIKQCSKHNTLPVSSWDKCLTCLSRVIFFS